MPNGQQKMVYMKDENSLTIKAVSPDGKETKESSSVEALLLFDIRYELQQMNEHLDRG